MRPSASRFSKLVASPELRQNFVASTIRFLREHQFDGLDLDWEYPGYRDGSSHEDRERYAQLIKVSEPVALFLSCAARTATQEAS